MIQTPLQLDHKFYSETNLRREIRGKICLQRVKISFAFEPTGVDDRWTELHGDNRKTNYPLSTRTGGYEAYTGGTRGRICSGIWRDRSAANVNNFHARRSETRVRSANE